MSQVYIVMGIQDDYENDYWDNWPVKAFFKMSKALAYRDYLNGWLVENMDDEGCFTADSPCGNIRRGDTKEGISYTVWNVNLEEDPELSFNF